MGLRSGLDTSEQKKFKLMPGILQQFLGCADLLYPLLAACMLPSETFEIGKRLLTLSLPKPIHNSTEFGKTYELFTFGDIHCIANSLDKILLK